MEGKVMGHYLQAFLAATICGLILASFTSYQVPTAKGLKGTEVIVLKPAPRNRKERRGFKPHPKHKPVV
jgi:hypothetical protein